MKKGVIVVGLILAILVCSLFISCEKVPEGSEISIMSFNIRQDTFADVNNKSWKVRRDYLVEHIKNNAPDILCMQEVQKNQYKYINNALEDYDTIWYSRAEDESEEGLAITYKKEKYELISKDMFWLSDTPDKESKGIGSLFLRICVHAVLKDKETGKQLSVYCVHLEVTTEVARNNEIEMILDRISKDEVPAVVCGDFNTTKDSDCFRAIAAEMNSVQDKAKDTESGITYQGFGAEHVSFADSIDFIFVDKSLYSKSFKILDEYKEKDGEAIYYSDHYAVLGTIIYPN